jgi:serine/threonine protein kinase
MSEKNTMAQLHHPFIVKLFATFQDSKRLFFLLQPCLGGDLFTYLRERTLFDEDQARFYAACVISAFEYMHDRNIVYRDLKPENLLIDEDGYLKVTDFGFAKDISSGRTWTLCGTPDYLAPEIVAGKGHGKGVDWWTVGVFIYEMLASYAPFYDEEPMKTYEKIVHGELTFPSHFSKEAVSLVRKLLNRKPFKRLGVTKGGASAIKKHMWFRGFDWEALEQKKLAAPYVPGIKSNVDMSHIDESGEQEEGRKFPPEVEPYTDDGTGWSDEFGQVV